MHLFHLSTWENLLFKIRACQLCARAARLWSARGTFLHMQLVISRGDREVQLIKKAAVVKFHRGGRRGRHGARFTVRPAYRGSWREITECWSAPRWISNPTHNTFHLLLHSGKQAVTHGANSQADFGCIALPTGGEGQKAEGLHVTPVSALQLLLSLQKRKIHLAFIN